MNNTEALRDAIKRYGRTLTDIEVETGTSRGILSRFVRGERTMTVESADRIIDGLGLTVKIIKASKSKPKK